MSWWRKLYRRAMTPKPQPSVRLDLAAAHAQAWAELGRSGAFYTGRQRVELVGTALRALDDREPGAPWMGPSRLGSLPDPCLAPAAAHDVVHRVACHAGTITDSWYQATVGFIGEVAWVELVALTATVAAIHSFRRSVGLDPWQLPVASDDPPTQEIAPDLVVATMNWVPVAAPADVTASVVQAFTALPAENARTWRLAAVQYMSDAEMDDPRFSRGVLTRPEMELLALRVAQRRDCFF